MAPTWFLNMPQAHVEHILQNRIWQAACAGSASTFPEDKMVAMAQPVAHLMRRLDRPLMQWRRLLGRLLGACLQSCVQKRATWMKDIRQNTIWESHMMQAKEPLGPEVPKKSDKRPSSKWPPLTLSRLFSSDCLGSPRGLDWVIVCPKIAWPMLWWTYLPPQPGVRQARQSPEMTDALAQMSETQKPR